MNKQFSDSEFRLYGNVQSFFYRCWSMYGAGAETDNNTSIKRKSDLMLRWGSNLFKECHYWKFVFLDDNGFTIETLREHETGHNIVELVVQSSGVLNYTTITIDLRHNLEDYNIFNIKWVPCPTTTQGRNNQPNTQIKEVPKVF